MADFDAAQEFNLSVAVWGGIAFDNVPCVDNLLVIQLDVAVPVHAAKVHAVFIRATNKISNSRCAGVHEHRKVAVHRPQGTNAGAHGLGNGLLAGKYQRRLHAGEFAGFDFIQFVIAAQNDRV